MNTKRMTTVLSIFVAALFVVTTAIANAGPNPVPPQANAYGKGYAKYAELWLEWLESIPAPMNPLLDPDGSYAAVGQSGKVWFLAGNAAGGETERSITIPSGTALFFPIVNVFWTNIPELGDDPWSDAQEAFVRDLLDWIADSSTDLVLEIDGKPFAGVYDYRVASTTGVCILPAENIHGADVGPHECVADGYWALLPPMSVGEHTVRFAGSTPPMGYALDVTYHVTVKPRQKVLGGALPPHP